MKVVDGRVCGVSAAGRRRRRRASAAVSAAVAWLEYTTHSLAEGFYRAGRVAKLLSVVPVLRWREERCERGDATGLRGAAMRCATTVPSEFCCSGLVYAVRWPRRPSQPRARHYLVLSTAGRQEAGGLLEGVKGTLLLGEGSRDGCEQREEGGGGSIKTMLLQLSTAMGMNRRSQLPCVRECVRMGLLFLAGDGRPPAGPSTRAGAGRRGVLPSLGPAILGSFPACRSSLLPTSLRLVNPPGPIPHHPSPIRPLSSLSRANHQDTQKLSDSGPPRAHSCTRAPSWHVPPPPPPCRRETGSATHTRRDISPSSNKRSRETRNPGPVAADHFPRQILRLPAAHVAQRIKMLVCGLSSYDAYPLHVDHLVHPFINI